jgi:RNA polymerase sigma-70 factor (ECF subfamily)
MIVPFRRRKVGAHQSEQPPATMPAAATEPGDEARWAAWMLRAQDGDRAAYHELLVGIAPYVRAIARRYLGRNEDAEDAVQDVLAVVHTIRHTYERGRPFKPWLSTIASRRCIDLLRRRAQRLRHEIETDSEPDTYAAHSEDPEQNASREHAADALYRAVEDLPVRQREAIRLLRLKELTLKEAAAQSAQSVGSLKVACHRAVYALRRLLTRKESSDD